jgi:glycosyltransferase involved in cell wall biosynthesis
VVDSPSRGGGGVERVARAWAATLAASGCEVRLRQGLREIGTPVAGKIDIYVGATWKTAAVGARTCRSSRHLIILHGAELTRDSGIALRQLRSATLARAELLATSPTAIDLMSGALLAKVRLVGPPLLRSGHATARLEWHRRETLSLCVVGRLDPRKGQDTAMAVARRIADHRPVHLLILGSGADEGRLKTVAARCAHPNMQVTFAGFQPDEVADSIVRDCDALLFLPRTQGTEYEGLGLVVLEAAALGTPAVVLACAGNVYSVADGVSGRLVRPERSRIVESVADAVLEVSDGSRFRVGAHEWASHFEEPPWAERLRMVLDDPTYEWTWPSA